MPHVGAILRGFNPIESVRLKRRARRAWAAVPRGVRRGRRRERDRAEAVLQVLTLTSGEAINVWSLDKPDAIEQLSEGG